MYCSSRFHLLSNCCGLATMLIMNIVASSPPDHPTAVGTVVFSTLQGRNRGSQRLHHFPRITQPLCFGASPENAEVSVPGGPGLERKRRGGLGQHPREDTGKLAFSPRAGLACAFTPSAAPRWHLRWSLSVLKVPEEMSLPGQVHASRLRLGPLPCCAPGAHSPAGSRRGTGDPWPSSQPPSSPLWVGPHQGPPLGPASWFSVLDPIFAFPLRLCSSCLWLQTPSPTAAHSQPRRTGTLPNVVQVSVPGPTGSKYL